MITVMKGIIESRISIHEYDLIDELDMKLSTYTVWKAYLLKRLDGFIDYDRATKIYRWIE
tara:strand:- start:7390 stop:7569 length:180 start_codon:yes stop_codon:yes gene_type:complete